MMNSIAQLARYSHSYEREAIGVGIAIIVIVIFLELQQYWLKSFWDWRFITMQNPKAILTQECGAF